jgi:hypothetical protein
MEKVVFLFVALVSAAAVAQPRSSGATELCYRASVEKLMVFDYDEASERAEIWRACQWNEGDRCVRTARKELMVFDYDDRFEVVMLASACRGRGQAECFDFVTRDMSVFDYDDLDEVVAILDRCARP